MGNKLKWVGLTILIVFVLRTGFIDIVFYFVISGHIRLLNFTVPPLAMLVLWTVIIPLLIALVASRGFYLPKVKLASSRLVARYLFKIGCQYPELTEFVLRTLMINNKQKKPTRALSRYLPIPIS